MFWLCSADASRSKNPIELYALPDDIQANSPETKLYKFTGVDDEVVLVDPTKMRVIAVIGPKPEQ